MFDVLVATVPITGHVLPLLALTESLTERGHRVRMITGQRFESAVRRAGGTFVALPSEADYDDRNLTNPANSSRPAGLGGLRYDVSQGFLAPARAQYQALIEQLAGPTDAVLVDPTFLGAMLLAAHPRSSRPPVILAGVLPLPMSSRQVPPFGLGLAPLTGPSGEGVWGSRILDRVRNRALRFGVEKVVFGPVQRELDDLFRSVHGQDAGAFVLDWASTLDAVAQFSVPAFEYPRPDAKLPIHFIGPAARPSTSPLPSWWGDLDGTRPVVLVTQGTLANTDLTALVRPTLRALAEEDVLVVATTGGRPVTELGPLPANARAAEFLPYDELLPHVDVMVTNGGYGGVHYALTHGVPLVVAGSNEDKPEVAARVAWSGVGVNLRTGRPKPTTVRRAVQRVLANPRYRQAAAVLRGQIAASGGADDLIRIIDDLGQPSATEPAVSRQPTR